MKTLQYQKETTISYLSQHYETERWWQKDSFAETNPEEIISSLQKDGKYDFDIDGEIISLDNEDFIIDFDANENFAVSKRDNYIVFISTLRNREMMAKGLVKDVARRLQTLRKERGYNPTDVLGVASILDLDDESLEMVKERADELAFLVRVKQVNFAESCKEYKDDDIDGQKNKNICRIDFEN